MCPGAARCSHVKAFLPPCGLWQEPGLPGRRPGPIAFPSTPIKPLWTLAGAPLDRPLRLPFQCMWGGAGGSPRCSAVQELSEEQEGEPATSRPGLSVGRAFLRPEPRDARPQHKEGHMEKLAKGAVAVGLGCNHRPLLHNGIGWGEMQFFLLFQMKIAFL